MFFESSSSQLDGTNLGSRSSWVLVSGARERTIFHEIAITDPTRIKNALAFNFVSYESEFVQAVRKSANLPCVHAPTIDTRDIYGWKTSDYLIAHGAMDSLLMVCVYIVVSHIGENNLKSIDFSCMALCSALFTGPGNALMQVPPELSEALDGKSWPASGKTPRQLAHDLGHVDMVELIDFLQFHGEGSLLLTHAESTTAFIQGSFASIKAAAMSFVRHVEAKSKCASRHRGQRAKL